MAGWLLTIELMARQRQHPQVPVNLNYGASPSQGTVTNSAWHTFCHSQLQTNECSLLMPGIVHSQSGAAALPATASRVARSSSVEAQ